MAERTSGRSAQLVVAALGVTALALSRTIVAALLPSDGQASDLVATSVWAATMLAAYGAYRARSQPVRASPSPVTRPPAGAQAAAIAVASALAVSTIASAPAGASRLHLLDVVLVGPIGEEADFRGLIWAIVAWWLLRRSARAHDLALVSTTALVFALAHLQYYGFRVDLGVHR